MASSSSSSALFKDHEKFAKRQADATAFLASAEKRQKVEKPSSQKSSRPKSNLTRSKTSSDFANDYQPSSTTNKVRLYTRANVIEKLQERFLSGQTDSVTLDELIEESDLTIDPSDKHWLVSQALLSNEKIDVIRIDDVNKFVYKPPLDLKAPKRGAALLTVLKGRHERCQGALLVDDVRDSIPRARADNIIDNLVKTGDVARVTNNSSKKDVLFYTDPSYNLRVNPDFIEAWRRISVEGLDDKKISDYLTAHGHQSLARSAPRQSLPTKPVKRGGRRPDTMKHNQHVAKLLEDYSNPPTKK